MRKIFIVIAAVALVASFTLPVMAAEKSVSFYGRVWMDTFFTDYSKEWKGLPDDDTDLLWNLEGNGTSRFGAMFKWDSLAANVEIRPLSGSMYRQWWGSWNFGSGTLLVGHTWSPLYLNTTICGQCEAGGSAGGYGFWVGDLRRAQIRLTFGDLIIALVEPSTGAVTNLGAIDYDTTLPKLEAVYTFKTGPVTLIPFLGYQTYDAVTAADKDYGIDGYVAGISAKASVGPGYVNAQLWMSQNDKNWGNLYHGGFGGAYFDGTSVKDEDGLGYAITAGMPLSKTMKFEVGYGHSEWELDAPVDTEDDQDAYYAQLDIQLAPGFFITPEIGVVDKGDQKVGAVTTDEGKLTYYGAVWKIHF
jgi:hypothetical protein